MDTTRGHGIGVEPYRVAVGLNNQRFSAKLRLK